MSKSYKDREWLFNQYITLKKSQGKIAEMCDGGDIHYWLKKHGIPTRSHSEAQRGINRRPFTEEHKKNMSKAAKGRKLSEETRKKMSNAQTGEKNSMYSVDRSGEKNPMFGKHHSEETKKKISEANYKGEDVTINQLHSRAKKIKLIPEVCDICHRKCDKYGCSKLELSNIKDHKYTDNPDDYQYVHHSCHSKYDANKRVVKELKNKLLKQRELIENGTDQ